MSVVIQQTKQTDIAHLYLRLEQRLLQWQQRVDFESDV